jgi:hypothetical protein
METPDRRVIEEVQQIFLDHKEHAGEVPTGDGGGISLMTRE